jgi:hypothetical protein
MTQAHVLSSVQNVLHPCLHRYDTKGVRKTGRCCDGRVWVWASEAFPACVCRVWLSTRVTLALGTTEGNPADRLMSVPAGTFALHPVWISSKIYFLTFLVKIE